jgi:DNA-binding beta-propeller fold protein YncE
VDPGGGVYVADTDHHRIQQFTGEGSFIALQGGPGNRSGQFSFPEAVAIDSAGHIYVADTWNHRIQKFASDWSFLGTWGTHGARLDQFIYPEGIVADGNGNVYVADAMIHRILKLSPLPTLAWSGQYFNSRFLAGRPVLTREDAQVDFDWGTGAPGPGLGVNDFSVRWTRTVYFDEGAYRFTTIVNGGLRLWVDDRLLIDQWQDQAATYNADVSLTRGCHRLQLEYYDGSGSAAVHLNWAALQ